MSTTTEVGLTKAELLHGASVGVRRHVESLLKGLKDKHGADPAKGWDYHIKGAIGELAFSKARNLYWDGSVNTFRSRGDVGDIEVKTRSAHWHDLIVRPDDHAGRTFVLVTGEPPGPWKIHGWIEGREAHRDEWWKDPNGRGAPAWFVPKSALHPMP